ncbi:hypothetical protein VKT23_015783 [Stygiomarasmius scandens]|uniref:DUF6697 domain-containing protein n=1 Tax=Marasmiellus scandens TaxID=2682957 RepID=A0ABR1IZ08_9AGAR
MESPQTVSVLTRALNDAQNRVQELEKLRESQSFTSPDYSESSVQETALKEEMQRLREENEILKEQLVSAVNLGSPGVKKEEFTEEVWEMSEREQVFTKISSLTKEKEELLQRIGSLESLLENLSKKNQKLVDKKKKYKETIEELEQRLEVDDMEQSIDIHGKSNLSKRDSDGTPSNINISMNDMQNQRMLSSCTRIIDPKKLLTQSKMNNIVRSYVAHLPKFDGGVPISDSDAVSSKRDDLVLHLNLATPDRVWSHSNIFFFPGRILAAGKQHEIVFTVASQRIPHSNCSVVSQFELLYGQVRELFVVRGSEIIYAGTFKALNMGHLAPEGFILTVSPLLKSLDKLVESAYPAKAPVNYPRHSEVEQMIRSGELGLEVMALQCVGFDEELYRKLSLHYHQQRILDFERKRKAEDMLPDAKRVKTTSNLVKTGRRGNGNDAAQVESRRKKLK